MSSLVVLDLQGVGASRDAIASALLQSCSSFLHHVPGDCSVLCLLDGAPSAVTLADGNKTNSSKKKKKKKMLSLPSFQSLPGRGQPDLLGKTLQQVCHGEEQHARVFVVSLTGVVTAAAKAALQRLRRCKIFWATIISDASLSALQHADWADDVVAVVDQQLGRLSDLDAVFRRFELRAFYAPAKVTLDGKLSFHVQPLVRPAGAVPDAIKSVAVMPLKAVCAELLLGSSLFSEDAAAIGKQLARQSLAVVCRASSGKNFVLYASAGAGSPLLVMRELATRDDLLARPASDDDEEEEEKEGEEKEGEVEEEEESALNTDLPVMDAYDPHKF